MINTLCFLAVLVSQEGPDQSPIESNSPVEVHQLRNGSTAYFFFPQEANFFRRKATLAAYINTPSLILLTDSKDTSHQIKKAIKPTSDWKETTDPYEQKLYFEITRAPRGTNGKVDPDELTGYDLDETLSAGEVIQKLGRNSKNSKILSESGLSSEIKSPVLIQGDEYVEIHQFDNKTYYLFYDHNEYNDSPNHHPSAALNGAKYDRRIYVPIFGDDIPTPFTKEETASPTMRLSLNILRMPLRILVLNNSSEIVQVLSKIDGPESGLKVSDVNNGNLEEREVDYAKYVNHFPKEILDRSKTEDGAYVEYRRANELIRSNEAVGRLSQNEKNRRVLGQIGLLAQSESVDVKAEIERLTKRIKELEERSNCSR